ncbi:hypothetical protein Q2332_25645, partial [Escherichia coli]|nr:hypothetical protein [Escherichia coli]
IIQKEKTEPETRFQIKNTLPKEGKDTFIFPKTGIFIFMTHLWSYFIFSRITSFKVAINHIYYDSKLLPPPQ